MTKLQFAYNIRFELPLQPESAAAVAAKFLKTLDSLSRIDALFTDWRIIDPQRRSSRPLAEVRPQVPGIVARNVARDEEGPSPEEGYYASAAVGKFEDPKSAGFSVHAGGKLENYGKLEFGSWRVRPDPSDCDLSALSGSAAGDQCGVATELGLRHPIQDGLLRSSALSWRAALSLHLLPY